MRDYSKISGRFWTGKTGKKLRGNTEAQLIALYLMTSPHATMTGVYHVPVVYIAHETGLTLEGAWKGLRECIEEGFCYYDEASETVFVVEMAAYQVGEVLKPGDKQRVFVYKQFVAIADKPIQKAFFERYRVPYGLPHLAVNDCGFEGASKPLPRICEGASKGLPSQEQEQDQEQEQEEGLSASAGADAPPCKSDPIQYKQIFDAYNRTMTGLQKVRKITAKRRSLVRRTWQTAAEYRSPEFFAAYFAECQDDPFLNGTGPYRNGHENWRPDFDYLLRPDVVTKVYERALDRMEREA